MTSTREDFADGYDLSNEFFRLWLGERMSYTCAVFDEHHTTLDQIRRELDIQFKRIAQLQGELDLIKSERR